MNYVQIDTELASQLRSSPTPVRLCDPTGVIIGTFTPVPPGKFVVPFTDEELRASLKKGGRPLADILADLEASK